MSDRGEGIARSFGGLGFYRGCSIIFAPLEKTATTNSKPLSLSPANERDTPNQIQPSHQASKHLLELQKEIKEEEDEIFADINSLIDSRSNLYFAFGDDDDDVDVNVEQVEKTRSLVKLDGDENLPVGDFLLQSQLNNNHHTNPNYNYNNNNNNNNNNNSTGLRQNLRIVSQQQQLNPSPHPSPAHHLRETHHRHQQHKIDESLFINDSDDINDYASTSADDTNTNDYQSESFTGVHSSSSGTNNTTQPSTTDTGNNPYINSRSKSMAETRHTVDHTQTKDEENNQYFQGENDHLYLSEEKLHEQEEARQERQKNDEATALQDHYMDEHIFSANITDPQQYQAIQEVIQQVQSNLPKPCVFFLEGNCRRSDCKYSHDLSNITCKYWIEGFCFKGELCPFLHSYNPPVDPNLLDSDELDFLAKKQLNPTFAIESEADFPSLPLDAPPSALNDSTKSSINTDPAAIDIKHQILVGNPAVVFKTAKKKRKRG